VLRGCRGQRAVGAAGRVAGEQGGLLQEGGAGGGAAAGLCSPGTPFELIGERVVVTGRGQPEVPCAPRRVVPGVPGELAVGLATLARRGREVGDGPQARACERDTVGDDEQTLRREQFGCLKAGPEPGSDASEEGGVPRRVRGGRQEQPARSGRKMPRAVEAVVTRCA
jgi:hypothetical protein